MPEITKEEIGKRLLEIKFVKSGQVTCSQFDEIQEAMWELFSGKAKPVSMPFPPPSIGSGGFSSSGGISGIGGKIDITQQVKGSFCNCVSCRKGLKV